MNHFDEKELIQNIQKGEVHLFKELYESYKDLVFGICFKFLENNSEAEDLTQDIFIKVYNFIDKFRFDSKFSTWLYKISVNHCLNYLRKKRKIQFLSFNTFIVSSDQEEHSCLIDRNMNIEQMINQEEMEKIVRRAVNSLPEKQRTAILLNKFEGLSYSETALIMETTVSSIESLLFRAKQNLCKILLKYYKDI